MTREEKIASLVDELEDIRCDNFDADTDEDKTLKEAIRVIEVLKQEPCEDCISKANALRVAKNEYLRGWHDALCKALSEKYSIHCEEGNFSVIQEETITGLGLSMNCAVGKDVESYMSALPSVTPTRKTGRWIDKTHQSGCGVVFINIECSECGKPSGLTHTLAKYCPNCGAKMTESEE